MSARREKRLRSLERRVQKLEVMASAGFLESNLREELAKVNNRPENAWWCRTPTDNIPQDAEYQQVPHRTVRQRIKDFSWEVIRNETVHRNQADRGGARLPLH